MKKFFSLLMLLALVLALMSVSALAEDLTIDFESGSVGAFSQSGSCSVAVSDSQAHDGTQSLAVTCRSGQNWDAADLDLASLAAPGSEVTLTAWVYVDSDAEGTFCIAKAGGDYGWYGSANFPGRVWTQVTAKIQVPADMKIRFQNYGDAWNSADFYLDGIVLSGLKSESAPAANAETVVSSFDFESGVPAAFAQSGAASPRASSAQAHTGTASLLVTGRSGNDWDALDLKPEAVDIALFAPVKLSFFVYVDSEEAGSFRVAKGGGDYATLGSANLPGRVWTEITCEFTLDQLVNLRFQNASANWNNAEFYIDDVTVEASVPAANESDDAPSVSYDSDFSQGLDGWYARSNGTAQVAVEDGVLTITGRVSTWNSPGRDFDLVAGRTYDINVLVKQDQHPSSGLTLSVAHTRDGSESYENLGSCSMKQGEWTLLSATYVPGQYEKYTLYIEGGEADLVFSMKDFSIKEVRNDFRFDIASLKDAYAGVFDFGTAVVTSEVLDKDRMAFYASQFSILTPGNEMKPDALLDIAKSKRLAKEDDTAVALRFDSIKPLLNWCRDNGVKMHAHVLVWHSQTPELFFYEGYSTRNPLCSRETMLGRMDNYIRQVMTWVNENYPGLVVSWDVVNEAVADGAGSAVKDCELRLRESNWTRTIGTDFVNRAFESAAKYKAEGQKLFYNDYNTEMTWKLIGIGRLLDSLIADGHIDGYGFQSHYHADNTSLTSVLNAWYNISSRKELRLRVSELDVGIRDTSAANFTKQANFYKRLFEIYLQFADRIDAVQVWGTVDDLSWRADSYPLLFDNKNQPKPAFDAVIQLAPQK